MIRFYPEQGTSSVIAEGGLLTVVNPVAVQIDTNGDLIIAALRNPSNSDLPSRLIRIDPVTGEQSLIAETTDRQFRDFAILEDTAYIAFKCNIFNYAGKEVFQFPKVDKKIVIEKQSEDCPFWEEWVRKPGKSEVDTGSSEEDALEPDAY